MGAPSDASEENNICSWQYTICSTGKSPLYSAKRLINDRWRSIKKD